MILSEEEIMKIKELEAIVHQISPPNPDILLSKEEILRALNELHPHFQDVVYHSDIRIAKAQLKKDLFYVVECGQDRFIEKCCEVLGRALLEEVK